MPPEEATPTTTPVETSPTSPAQTEQKSPASSPAETPSVDGVEPSSADAFSGFDFSNMDYADEGGDTTVIDNTKTEQGTVAPVAAPTQPAPVAADKPVSPQTPVEATPTAAPQPSPTPAPATPSPPASEAGQEDPYLKAYKDNQTAVDTELRNYYALDDVTAEKLLENPKEVLPAMLAKLHMSVQQNTYKAILDRLPTLVQATANAVQTNNQAEDRFFSAWKIFDRANPQQINVIRQYGTIYRQQNPQATEADFTKVVGALAATHLGLKPPATKGNGKGKPLPYSPAGSSAPSSGSGEPKPTQFEDMFSAILESE